MCPRRATDAQTSPLPTKPNEVWAGDITYHNAWTESFIGTLKAEMRRAGCFASQEDAAHELFVFIDSYYNTRRLHPSLNYKSPSLFESEIALAN